MKELKGAALAIALLIGGGAYAAGTEASRQDERTLAGSVEGGTGSGGASEVTPEDPRPEQSATDDFYLPEDRREPGIGDAGEEDELLPDYQVPAGSEPSGEGTGGSGEEEAEPEPAYDYEGYGKDPSGLSTGSDRSIMGNELQGGTRAIGDGTAGSNVDEEKALDTGEEPQPAQGVGGAGEEAEEPLQEEAPTEGGTPEEEGSVFETGDVGNRLDSTIPEGDYPGPAAPLPDAEDF